MVNLPEDVLKQILLRLPVKSLVRFKCVSKSWLDLLTSPLFIEMHLKFSLVGDHDLVLVKRFLREESKNLLSLHVDDESLSIMVPNLEIQALNDESVRLIGGCNGIVCLFDYSNYILLNPATRQFRILPPCPACPEGFYCHTEGLGFGFDLATNDYKVVRIIWLDNSHSDDPDSYGYGSDDGSDFRKAEIYSLNGDTWREIDVVLPPLCNFQSGGFDLLFNGRIHWHAVGEFILSMDIGTESFDKFAFPKADRTSSDEDAGDVKSLAVIHDTLALILYTSKYPNPHPYQQFIDVWIMKEYGIEESWSKQYSIGPFSGIIRPISVWKNKRLLLERVIQGDIGHYNIQMVAGDLFHGEEQLLRFDVYGCEYTLEVAFYKETLVSVTKA